MNENKENQRPGQGGDKNNNRGRQPLLLLIVFALVAMLFTTLIYGRGASNKTEVPYSDFFDLVTKDQVADVTITQNRIEYHLVDGSSYESPEASESSALIKEATGQSVKTTYYTAYVADRDLISTLKEHKVKISGKSDSDTMALIYNIATFVIPLVLL